MLGGVSVVAEADGCYAVDLCLVAGIVPLIELADEVRRRVRARAGRDGVADRVGVVNVQFARVLSDAEILGPRPTPRPILNPGPGLRSPADDRARSAVVRLVGFLALVTLAAAGIVLAVFCIGTGTSGPSWATWRCLCVSRRFETPSATGWGGSRRPDRSA